MTVYTRAEMEKISIVIKRRRWKWLGHVLRMDNSRHAKIAISWTPDGKRKSGRPKEPLKGKERTLGYRHGITQPEWSKKEIDEEDLFNARLSSRTAEIVVVVCIRF